MTVVYNVVFDIKKIKSKQDQTLQFVLLTISTEKTCVLATHLYTQDTTLQTYRKHMKTNSQPWAYLPCIPTHCQLQAYLPCKPTYCQSWTDLPCIPTQLSALGRPAQHTHLLSALGRTDLHTRILPAQDYVYLDSKQINIPIL